MGLRPRVTMILQSYPQLSQTYIQTEIDALRPDYDLRLVSRRPPNLASQHHSEYLRSNDEAVIREEIRDFAPQVLHSHWMHNAKLVHRLAKATGTPFTIRAHSFDVLLSGARGAAATPVVNETSEALCDDLCLGVLAFPFTRHLFEKAGVPSHKIVDCFPVVDYRRFHDPSPNGPAVINVGACIPKKRMEDFVWLASELPELDFNLYAIGYSTPEIGEENRRAGSPVRIREPVEHREMPQVYKQHRWMVYTASAEYGTVGWPLAVAEAQAAGVGVCVAGIRPDIRTYVGKGGIVYESVAELREIISQPVPEENRQQGFEQARKSDIRSHLHRLTDLWRPALERRRAGSLADLRSRVRRWLPGPGPA